MTKDELRDATRSALKDIAPEADVSGLAPDLPFREQLDIDSMDQLNFVIRLHEVLGVEIPEADYPQLETLDGCADYLAAALAAAGR